MANSKVAGGDPVTAAKLNEITMGTTAPATPSEGWLWIDTSVSGAPTTKVYNGTAWVTVSGADWNHFVFWSF